MPFNPGNKRLQRALYGRNPGVPNGTTQMPDGKGGTITVTNGSVMNFGGNMKFGLYPTVGVGLDFLLKLDDCCRPGSTGGMCFNTVQPSGTCNVNGFIFN